MTEEMRPRFAQIINVSVAAAILLLLLAPPPFTYADTGPIQRLGNGIPTSIAASPDGKTIAVGSTMGVWFFDAATFTPTGFWDTGSWVKEVQYGVDGRYLRADDKVYDTARGSVVQIDSASLPWINHRCSFDGKLCEKDLYDPYDKTTITSTWIVNLETGILTQWLPGEVYPDDWPVSRDFAWGADGQTIYDVNGYSIRARDVATLQEKLRLGSFFVGDVSQVNWSAAGTEIASHQSVWNVKTAQMSRVRRCQWYSSEGVAYSCGSVPLGIYASHAVTVFDPTSGKMLLSFAPHHIWTVSAALNSSARFLSTSGADWLRCSDLSNAYACDVSIRDTSTRIWDAQSGRELAELPVLFYNLALSPDGGVVVGHTRDSLQAWDWKRGLVIWSVPEDIGDQCSLRDYGYYDFCSRISGSIAASPSGDYVASYAASADNAIRLRHLSTGALVTTLTGHTAAVSSVAFSPDGSKLAAGSYLDGTILIWPVP